MAARLSIFDILEDKAQGEAMDLAHGAPLFAGVTVDGGAIGDIVSGDLCIVTAGAKGFADLGIVPEAAEGIVPSYLWRFRKTGQFEAAAS